MPTKPPLAVALVAGTRPNFVKAAPLFHALRQRPSAFSPTVWVVQQHGTPAMNDEVREDLDIGGPAVRSIEVAGGGLGARLGSIIDGLTDAFLASRPGLVVVFGDVDTTLAGAIAAKRLHLPLAHVEAGLRSHDRAMPEELNRRMVDSISDLLFATSKDAIDTLVRDEGQDPGSVHFVGNLMIDALLHTSSRDHGIRLCEEFEVPAGSFALATFHRPSNVDERDDLVNLLSMLGEAAMRLPVLLPLHPRTLAALERHDLTARLRAIDGVHVLPPLRYRDFVSLLPHARVILTDSGGIQEESSVLGIPCFTVRGNTERPVTLELGSNRLIQPGMLGHELDTCLSEPMPNPADIPGWDGRAADRIADSLERWMLG